MKYICLGYVEPGTFENMSESDRNTMPDECFGYNDNCGGTDITARRHPPGAHRVWRFGDVAGFFLTFLGFASA